MISIGSTGRTSLSNLDLGVMRNGGLAVLSWQGNLEDAELILLHLVRVAVPVVCRISQCRSPRSRIDTALTEVTNEVSSQCIGSPLAIHDIAIGLDIETENLVALMTVSRLTSLIVSW